MNFFNLAAASCLLNLAMTYGSVIDATTPIILSVIRTSASVNARLFMSYPSLKILNIYIYFKLIYLIMSSHFCIYVNTSF